jgi:HEPN domain-containing protein
LLEKAKGDEAGLRAVAERSDVPDHVVGFLAQQAVEKALKAALTAAGRPFQRTHDIEYLCGLAEDAGIDLPGDAAAFAELNPWAVEFRYDDPVMRSGLDRADAVRTVAAATSWASRQIDG